MKAMWRTGCILTALLMLCAAGTARAQLSRQFSDIFETILKGRLLLSSGTHSSHFFQAAAQADSLLSPALNSLIVSNISSFPLSSTTPGISFSFAGGELVSVTEGLGPIFADRATTTGKGRINVGFNATYLDLTRFRGLATSDMRFTFAHQDLNGDNALGGNDPLGSTEGDLIDVTMGSSIQAYIFALYGTVGVTSNLDVGFAVPFIRVSMKGTATAVISSYTFANNGTALHRFGGTETSPVLQTSVPYSESATGIGDVALRLKYCFLRGAGVDLGALVDVRIPTGKPENFLGSKKTGVMVAAIFSKKIGEFAPHLNVGYEVRSAEFQSSRVIVKGGFDQKLIAGLTFAGDFLGTFDTESAKAIHLSPGTASILDAPVAGARAIRTLRLSNIPDSENDNLYNLSAGFRYAPSASVMVLANVLVPLNSGGLRAPVAPTLGFSVTL